MPSWIALVLKILCVFYWEECVWVLRIEPSSSVEGGKKWPLCVCCILLPTFMAAGCCVLLLPFVGAFLQCSLLHSWQIVCRGRFSAVQQPLRLHLSISPCFASVNIPLRGTCVWREIPAKHRAWSESMNHAWTCAGNTPFSLWFVISG